MSHTKQKLQQFELLANKFETLAAEMNACKNPERRIELLQRMKVLIDEIDVLIFTSLHRETMEARVADSNPNPIPEGSAT
jgi:hypothetical protein